MTEQFPVEQIISIMDAIEQKARDLPRPAIDKQAISKMMEVSRVTTAQPKRVVPRPIGWNLLEAYGYPHKKPLLVDDPLTEGEEAIYEAAKEKLKTLFGAESTVYDLHQPIDSPAHYAVDNWRNLKPNMRDQVPGEAEQRAEAFKQYNQPKPGVGVREKLRREPLFVKACSMVFEVLPQIHAMNDIVEASGPFMTKHTNVGYIGPVGSGLNDRTTVPNTNVTAAEYSRKIAEDIMSSPNWEDRLYAYRVWAALGKNKRAKGRAVEAASRIISLCINQIQHPEIEAVKWKSPPFAGYRSPEELKRVLSHICDDCKKYGLWATNWDQSSYDTHVSPDLLSLIGAMAVLKANGEKSKRLAFARAVIALRGYLVNGMTGDVEEIFGRIFSGFIDTNLSGSKVNLIISLFCLMIIDHKHSVIWYKLLYSMLVMGDDNLQVYRWSPDFHLKYVQAMSEYFGMEVNPNKGEEGVFFLQRRLFTPEGYDHYVCVTPATRVLKSMLFGESDTSLGKFGWVLSYVQMMAPLIEYPPALDFIVSLLYPYDKMKFGIEWTAKEIGEMVKIEDTFALEQKKARASLKSRGWGHMSAKAVRARVRYTADLLYDGDPSKTPLFVEVNGVPEINSGYVDSVLMAIRESVDRVQPQIKVQPYSKTELKEEYHARAS